MLTWEEDVEAAALREQGWSIQAIARDAVGSPTRSAMAISVAACHATVARS